MPNAAALAPMIKTAGAVRVRWCSSANAMVSAAIQGMFITPTTSSSAISAQHAPAQLSPPRTPAASAFGREPAVPAEAWSLRAHARRHSRFQLVNWYSPATMNTAPPPRSTQPVARPRWPIATSAPNATAPRAIQIARYPARKKATEARRLAGAGARRRRAAAGVTAGSIIATIIAAHMPVNSTGWVVKAIARPTPARPCTIDDIDRASSTVIHQARAVIEARTTSGPVAARRPAAGPDRRSASSARLPAIIP
jgi:hypothetical protein